MNELTTEELCEQIGIRWKQLRKKHENHEITSLQYAQRRRAYDHMIAELIIKDEDRLPYDEPQA